jgi:uncharacterized protein YjbI with pentapeptide repeats
MEQKLARAIRRGDAQRFNTICKDATEGAPLSVAGETFEKVDLMGFDLGGIDMSNTEWQNCTFNGVRFSNGNLEGAYFVGCGFIECEFEDTSADGLALEGSIMRSCTVLGGDFSNSELETTEITDSSFKETSLGDISWTSMTLSSCFFDKLAMTGALSRVKLRACAFEDCELEALETQGCHLLSPQLSRTNLPSTLVPRSGRRRNA